MCGIVGFNWVDKKNLIEASNVISHRGPDDKGHFFDEHVSLAHRRLSIIDLSEKGHQPMKRLNYIIVFNGEIYNYKEIKEELKEYNFTSDSDTEVIIYAYDKWKEKCLEKFNGAFALAIYDLKKKELFLARDRFGIKPLYYFYENGRFIFCSELKGILPFLSSKTINEGALRQFFSFRFTFEDTIVQGIKKLLPGHYMRFSLIKKELEIKSFYLLKPQRIKNINFNEAMKRTAMLMDKSVRRRMVADVPVGCLLSGGIDSSIITALAKKYSPNLNTFSVGFDTTNELSFARIVARHIKTKHHEIILTRNNVEKYLDAMIYHMDEPIGDPGFLPVFVLSKEIHKFNKVVLSGDGGDEVFCGYDRYKMYYYGLFLRNFVPTPTKNDVIKRLYKMKGKDNFKAFFEVIRLFDKSELKRMGIEEYDASSFWVEDYKEKVFNAQRFDLSTVIPNDFLMKTDKMSSAFGVEQRVPFLDHELVEFSFTLPLRYKLRFWNEKYILKKTFSHILPEVITKRRKHGFDVPIDYWFKNILGKKLKKTLERNKHNLYNKSYVYTLLDEIKRAGQNYKMNFILAQKLWSVLVFEMWYERFMK